MSEIDWIRAVKSPLTALFWVKTIMYGLGIGFLVMVGYGFYKAYFKKPEPTQVIHAEAGSNLLVNQPSKASSKWHLFVAGGLQEKEDEHAGWLGLVGVSYDL